MGCYYFENLFIALTESPPPIHVWAEDLAIISVISFVPLLNFSISNTPIGPFQNIFLDESNILENEDIVLGPISIPKYLELRKPIYGLGRC